MLAYLLKKYGARPGGRAEGKLATLMAPVGGWNARDAVTAMKPTDAIVLENIIPGIGRVYSRPGYLAHATGMAGSYIETLMEYEPPTGSNVLFAAAPANIYNVTAAGAVGAAVQTGLTNGRWSHLNFATTGGNFLCMVNGADNYRTWDGTSWTDRNAATTGITLNGAASDTTSLIGVSAHGSRLWFTQKNSLDLWYLGTAAVQGAATIFKMGAVFKKGGYILCTTSWSRDGGDGSDDAFVVISNKGEVAVYVGTDPAAAATWELQGVYRIAEPIGRRCTIKVGADIGIITSAGVALLSEIARINLSGQKKVAITNKVSRAFQEAYTQCGTAFGWQVQEYPKEGLVIVNVPWTERVTAYQFVINVETGAWCKFTNVNAGCWGLLGDVLYFGGHDGKTYKFGEATDDNGATIPWKGQLAYTDLGTPRTKVMNLARVNMTTTLVDYSPGIEVKVDFDEITPITAEAPAYTVSGTLWDTADWDTTDWGSGSTRSRAWQTVVGQGTHVSVCFVGSAADFEFVLNSFDLIYQPGHYL